MKTSVQHKLSNIQSLRGFAALLVVLTHLGPMEIKHSSDAILPAFLRFGISGVDLFFVISGFIMVYVTWDQSRSIKRSLKFLFARFTRIYPIYWVIALAIFLMWSVKPNLISFDPENTSIVKSFLLLPDQNFPMLKVAWTLIHELYFYLVFSVILLFSKRYLIPALCVWAVIFGVGNLSGLGRISPELALIFHPLTAEFLLGALAAWAFMKTEDKHGMTILALGIGSFTCALIYLSIAYPETAFPSQWARVGYFGIPASLIVYGVSKIEKTKIIFPKWSSTFGDWSYSLYLSHILSLSVLGYLWRPFNMAGPIDNIIAIIILILGSVIGSALLWYLCEKPMLLVFKKLRGKIFQ